MESVDFYMNRLIPVLVIVIGSGMIAIWGMDILSGKFSGQGNFFRWTEGENRLWPHISAEILTGIVLIAAGIGLMLIKPWSVHLLLAGLGAVIYSSINSSGWVILRKERLPYGIPIWISLVISLFILFRLI